MTPRENYLMVYQHKTPEWIPNVLTECNFMTPMQEIERYDGMESGTDGFGVHWTYVESACAPMPSPDHPPVMNDICQWRQQVKFPDLDSYDWEKMAKISLSCCDDTKLYMAMNINGMFERLHACMGMTEALCSLVEEPRECYEFFGAVADHKIGMIRRIRKYFKADVFNMHDDYGMDSGPFMSLYDWRRLLKPHLKRIVDACHAEGMYYQHHSCGYIEPFVDDLVEIGIDAMDTWQVCNTQTRAFKDKYQDRLAFIGGLDNQNILDRPLPEELEEEEQEKYDREVYDEFKRATDLLAPGGSYIPFPITLTMNFVPGYFQYMEREGKDFYRNHPECVR